MADGRAAKFMEGYVPMPMKALCDDQVEAGAICLFGVLFWHMRKKGFCWPTLDRLAGLMTCSVDTIRRRLKKLVEAQWIRIEKPPMDGNTYYHLGPRAPVSTVLQPCNEPLQICNETVADLQPDLEQEKEYIHNTTRETGPGALTAIADADLQESFDRFWNAYPRRVARLQCLQIWLEIRPDTKTVECMLAAIARCKRSQQWQRHQGQFIPFPKTWLAQRRWEDDLPLFDGDRLQKRQQQLAARNEPPPTPPTREQQEEWDRFLAEQRRKYPLPAPIEPPGGNGGRSRDPP